MNPLPLLAAVSLTVGSALGQNATVTVDFSHPNGTVPPTFVGLSFETNRTHDGTLSPGNASLIRWVNALGPQGVFRLGGNTSDRFHPTQDDLVSLSGFVHATGWKLIYGLNYLTGTPEEAADTANQVQALLGDRLLAFQIGNEPDDYPAFGVTPYVPVWRRFADAVRAKVPNASFMGPDVSADTSWLGRFAAGTKGYNIALTHHFYPIRASVTNAWNQLNTLLSSIPQLQYRATLIEQQDATAKLSLRMTEMNSASGGGQLGVSDTFGATLWAVTAFHALASRGWSGVNLHSNDPSPYSPLLKGSDVLYHPQPVYWGLLWTALHTFGQTAPSSVTSDEPLLYAFASLHSGKRTLLLCNLSQNHALSVRLPAFDGNRLLSWTLSGDNAHAQPMRINGVTVDESLAAFNAPGAFSQQDAAVVPLGASTVKLVKED